MEPEWGPKFQGDDTEPDLENFEYKLILVGGGELHSDDWNRNTTLHIFGTYRKRRIKPSTIDNEQGGE